MIIPLLIRATTALALLIVPAQAGVGGGSKSKSQQSERGDPLDRRVWDTMRDWWSCGGCNVIERAYQREADRLRNEPRGATTRGEGAAREKRP